MSEINIRSNYARTTHTSLGITLKYRVVKTHVIDLLPFYEEKNLNFVRNLIRQTIPIESQSVIFE
jgi:hypothetical protein